MSDACSWIRSDNESRPSYFNRPQRAIARVGRVIGRLTGIATPADLDGLARALNCNAGEVRTVLRTRGDSDVLDFLPKPEASAGLDDALATLEDHIEKARGVLP